MDTNKNLPAGESTLFSVARLEKKTDVELQELLVRMTDRSRDDCGRRDCTIRLLARLGYAARTNLIGGMSRQACLEILAEPCCARVATR